MAAVRSWEGFPTSRTARHPPLQTGGTDHGLPFTGVLTVVDHAGVRSVHPFSHPRMVIGRTPENDLMLGDPNISTRHCELLAEAGFLVVRDLGSANGTFVNERRVSEARLKNADVVRVGRTAITVGLDERRLRALAKGPGKWVILGTVLALACLAGAFAWRQKAALRETEARGRYEGLVKLSAQRDVCGRSVPAFGKLREVDVAIGSRSIAIELVGERVRQSRAGHEGNLALLALWKKKQALYGDASTEVGARQQSERDALEKVTRLGARLGNTKDRKIAFWIDGLLIERIAATDSLMTGLRDASKRTAQLVELIERYSEYADARSARDLAAYQIGAGAEELLAKCESEAARLASGVLGALNGLDEPDGT